MLRCFYIVLLSYLLAPVFSFAEDNSYFAGNRYVKGAIISDRLTLQPTPGLETKVATLGIKLEIENGWHIYWLNSGESGSPTTVNWRNPSGFEISALRWPAPERQIEKGGITTYGYSQETILLADLYALTSAPQSGKIEIRALLSFLVCKDICVPGMLDLTKELTLDPTRALEISTDQAAIKRFEARTPVAASMLKEISIQGSLHEKDDRNLIAKIVISGLNLPSTATAASELQIFPFDTENFQALISAARITTSGATAVISFPVKRLTTAELSTASFSGIAVFSPKLYPAEDLTNVTWTINYTAAPIAIPDAGELLTYRVHDFSTKSTRGVVSEQPSPQFSLKLLLLAVLSGFIAGLILNLMPCVLPIVAIKAMALVRDATQPRAQKINGAIAYTVGVLTSFAALAILIIFLRSVGRSVGWGFQFQEPGFVFILFLIVFVLSLAFFDFYTFQLPFLSKANRALSNFKSGSLVGNFFEGLLVTALSTPCTAPFLGSALAFAFTQSAPAIIIIFLSIGLGLALPYAVLSTNDKFIRFIPKPGEWTYRFRELMGFLLLGTAVWLLFVLHGLSDEGAVWAVLQGLVTFFLLWAWRVLAMSSISSFSKQNLQIFALILCLFSLIASWPHVVSQRSSKPQLHDTQIAWEPFSKEIIDNLSAQSRIIFIDFTADWCITCKYNERFILNQSQVIEAFKKYKIRPIKADWTRREDEITKALKQFGGQGVPHYVLIIPQLGAAKSGLDPEIVVLPTILTGSTVVSELQRAYDRFLAQGQAYELVETVH
ncbi:thioredoxin family protein [bacterium]|nr:thioredoxin family protein [bacterium]